MGRRNEESTILGTMAVRNNCGPAIDIVAAGAIDASKMAPHTLPLKWFMDRVARLGRGEGLKLQIDPSF